MMENFQYYAPTKVVFGKGTENKAGQLVKEQNCRKVLIHYGSGSVKRSGLLDGSSHRLMRKGSLIFLLEASFRTPDCRLYMKESICAGERA